LEVELELPLLLPARSLLAAAAAVAVVVVVASVVRSRERRTLSSAAEPRTKLKALRSERLLPVRPSSVEAEDSVGAETRE
jgi:hypothetical protein